MGQTGVPTPEAPSGQVLALAVPAGGGRVYVGGNFLDLGGQGGMVVLDGATGAALPQQWPVDRPVYDLTVWPGDATTVFAATGGPGGRIYAFRPSQPTKPLWKAGVDGDAMAVAATNTTVFLIGHYDFIVPKDVTCYQYCPERHGAPPPRRLRRRPPVRSTPGTPRPTRPPGRTRWPSATTTSSSAASSTRSTARRSRASPSSPCRR